LSVPSAPTSALARRIGTAMDSMRRGCQRKKKGKQQNCAKRHFHGRHIPS